MVPCVFKCRASRLLGTCLISLAFGVCCSLTSPDTPFQPAGTHLVANRSKMPPKRIPSSFSSKAIKDGDYIKGACTASKLSATKLPTSNSKAGGSSARARSRSKAAVSSVSKGLKVRSDDPTVLMNPQEAMAAMAKASKGKSSKTKANSPFGTALTHVDSSAPTAILGPPDYEHIYKASGKAKHSAKGSSDALATVASEAPTALIAPADYEHIFKADPSPPKKKDGKDPSKSKRAVDKRIPSDAPTALVMAVAKQDAHAKQLQPKQSVSKVKHDAKEAGPSNTANKAKAPQSTRKDPKEAAAKPSHEHTAERSEPMQQPPSAPESGCCCVVM